MSGVPLISNQRVVPGFPALSRRLRPWGHIGVIIPWLLARFGAVCQDRAGASRQRLCRHAGMQRESHTGFVCQPLSPRSRCALESVRPSLRLSRLDRARGGLLEKFFLHDPAPLPAPPDFGRERERRVFGLRRGSRAKPFANSG